MPFPASMTAMLVALFATLRSTVRSRLDLQAEILALRHNSPYSGAKRRGARVSTAPIAFLWVLLSRLWPNRRRTVQIVTPDTVVRWHRRGFAVFWRGWPACSRG